MRPDPWRMKATEEYRSKGKKAAQSESKIKERPSGRDGLVHFSQPYIYISRLRSRGMGPAVTGDASATTASNHGESVRCTHGRQNTRVGIFPAVEGRGGTTTVVSLYPAVLANADSIKVLPAPSSPFVQNRYGVQVDEFLGRRGRAFDPTLPAFPCGDPLLPGSRLRNLHVHVEIFVVIGCVWSLGRCTRCAGGLGWVGGRAW
jgi:hypothetical protein